MEVSYKRNRERETSKQVPRIVYSVYKKYFSEPELSEGFETIETIETI